MLINRRPAITYRFFHNVGLIQACLNECLTSTGIIRPKATVTIYCQCTQRSYSTKNSSSLLFPRRKSRAILLKWSIPFKKNTASLWELCDTLSLDLFCHNNNKKSKVKTAVRSGSSRDQWITTQLIFLQLKTLKIYSIENINIHLAY